MLGLNTVSRAVRRTPNFVNYLSKNTAATAAAVKPIEEPKIHYNKVCFAYLLWYLS